MKTFLILTASAASSSQASLTSSRIEKSFEISPLRLIGDTNIGVSANASSKKPVSFECYLYNDIYSDGVLIFKKKITDPGYFQYVYDNRHTQATNNKIEIRFIYPARTETYRHEIDVSTSPKYIVLDENKSVISECKCLTWDGEWEYETQEYTFKGFDEVYMPNFYQKIDLNDFKICVEGAGVNAFNFKGTLTINNVRGLFQNLCDDGNTKAAKLAIKAQRIGDGYYVLKLDEKVYVDKFNLFMSKEKFENYLETQYIYLPRDNMRFQEEISCSLSLNNFGADNDIVKYPFKLKALNNVMGDCHNSEYCIIRK